MNECKVGLYSVINDPRKGPAQPVFSAFQPSILLFLQRTPTVGESNKLPLIQGKKWHVALSILTPTIHQNPNKILKSIFVTLK